MAQPSNQYKADFNKQHYARIEIVVPKQSKPCLDAVAKAAGEKTSEYIKNAILMRMGVKDWPVLEDQKEEGD